MQAVIPAARAASTSNDPSQARSVHAVGTAGVVIKAQPGRLYILDVTNHGTTAYVLMVFDKATAPANADAPIWRIPLPAGDKAQLDFAAFGLGCTAGISFAISTAASPDTLTLPGAADCHWHAQYK